MIVVAQIDGDFVKGVMVVVTSLVLFAGSVMLLTGAIAGRWMGYLITATGFFGFMVILTALWSFGAPGTPAFLGPKGELPHWEAVGLGRELRSPTFPVIQEYPGGGWKEPGKRFNAEVEPATLAFQEFLAEEATRELNQAGQKDVQVAPEDFAVTDLRFTTAEETDLVAARAFATSGGPEVVVFGVKDEGNLSLPSYLFLAGSIIGFGIHLPLLSRAERKRKEILTGGEQAPWRGPA